MSPLMWSLIQKWQARRLATLTDQRNSARAALSHRNNVEAGSPGTETSKVLSSPSRREKEEANEAPLRGAKEDRIWVGITGEEDPLDPRNWPLLSRSKNITTLSFLIFTQAWAGAADTPANTQASRELGVSSVAENLSTAMYLFGIGSGSIFVGPISESVGRNPTYLGATFIYLLFLLGSALTPTFAGQVVCRYFVGLFSSATLATNGSSVGDQFRSVKRTFVFPVIAWANVAGPVMAPIVGGWVVSNPRLGWRWTEYITLIISAVAWVVALVFLRETYLPIILDWKARQLRHDTGDRRYVSEHAETASLSRRVKEVLPLPAKFLATEPVIAVLRGYLILLYSLLFTFLSGFDYIFKRTYGMSTAQTASCFTAIAVGATTATLTAPALYSWARRKTEHKRGASIPPEFRLWPAIITAPLLPVALFWLGWTNYGFVSMWSSLCACVIFGVVLISIYVSSYEYIIDSYGEHAAIALASITMVRYLVAGGMVMAARPMYEGIGVHWTMTLLGCVSVFLAPMPLLFKKYGTTLRERSPYAESPQD